MEEKKKDSIYELDGTVPLKKALPLGIQHILAMFLGNVSPLIIVCGMLEMSGVLKMTLIQNAMSQVLRPCFSCIRFGKSEADCQS
mgnify:CR=1 FL=1